VTISGEHRFVSRAPKLGFVPGFDGVRGLGIAVVLYEHSLADSVLGIYSFGPIVDLFFVLSGFLIVTLLLQEDRSNGTIQLRKFYMRRGLRLLPSVWLYLVTVIGLAALFAREYLGEVLKDAAAAFFYVYNLFYPPGTTIFRPDIVAQRSMSQLWTLSLEEQFYMLIGVVILVAVTRRWVRPLLVLLVGLALAAQWGRATGHYGPFLIALQRPDALLLGSALALVNAHWGDFDARARRTLKCVASFGVAIGVLTLLSSAHPFQRLGLPYWEGYPERFSEYTADVAGAGGRTLETYTPSESKPGVVYFIQFGHTIVIWAALPFVLAMARVKDWGMNSLLQWRPFMYMGRLSYSLYIWHGIGIMVAFALLPDVTEVPELLVRSMIVWITSFALAIPVYRYVELRFQRIKLGYSAERTAVDVSTGKEIDVSTGKSVDDRAP
jgi:peptidoglycan/LPS O-acetylase OafA/YrhL